MIPISKLCIELLRCLPAAGVVCIVVQISFLLVGFDYNYIDIICNLSTFSVLLQIVASYALRLSNWHRACVVYVYVVSLLNAYRRSVGFSAEALVPLRWVLLAIGMVFLCAYVRESFLLHRHGLAMSFRRLADSIDAGRCSINERDLLAALEIITKSKDKPDERLLRRIEEGYCSLADRVDELDNEIHEAKIIHLRH